MLVGFHIGRYLRRVLYLFLHLQARPRFDGETLSQGQGWWESFTKNEVVVFRLYLYQMDLVLTDLTDQHPSELPL